MDLSVDRGPNLVIVDALFLSLAVITSLLRCFTRFAVVRAFGADDWLMMVATSMYILYVTSGLVSAQHGTGRHWDTISEDDRSIAMKYWWLCYIWYDAAMIFARLSIGIFFLRLTITQWHVWLIYAVMGSTVAFGIVFLGVATGECTPASYFWDKDIEGWCLDSRIIIGLMYIYSTSSLFADMAFALLPVFFMKGLQMDRRTKYALMPILGMAWIASIAVVVRYGYLPTLGSSDFTYEAITIAVLSSAEQGMAITAGNLATLRPLFTRTFGVWGSTVQPHSNGMPPPSGGPANGGHGRTISRPRSICLASFLRGGDEESRLEGGKLSGIAVTTNIAVTSQKRNSHWSASRRALNESQEELHSQQSSETLDEGRLGTVPASFLAKNNGLQEN